LRSDGTLDDRTQLAVASVQAAGALFVLCTARPSRWMSPVLGAIGRRGVAICANGGVVWDFASESVLEAYQLEPRVAGEVVGLLQAAVPGGAWAVERTTGFGHEPAYEPWWPVPQDTVVDSIEALITVPPVKLMLRHRHLSADVLLGRAQSVVGHLVELSHSNAAAGLLEISAAGVSKATALARMCERLGIGAQAVLAFGDMPNDLPMLRWAGHGVAVANAHPEVLAAADEITAANDQAGVARVLERLYPVSSRPSLA